MRTRQTEKHLAISDNREMKMGRQILIFTLIFLVTACCAYILYFINGATFITDSRSGNKDGFTQIYPSYVAVQHIVKKLLAGGGFSAWTWSVGLGADNWNTYAAKLANPFTYLIIAFPEKYIDVGYTVVAILKQYCAGLAFLFFGRKIGLDGGRNILGSLCYALSNWMLWTATAQSGFDTAAILFPLLVLGTEKIIDRESPLLFIITVYFYLTAGVVWGYAAGIMIIFYYFLRQVCKGEVRDFRKFLRTTGVFFICGITGVLLASFFVSSILSSMTNATTNSGGTFRTWFTLKNYLSIPRALYKISPTGATSYSAIGLPVVAVLTLPMILGRAFKGKVESILAVLCLIGSQIPLICRMFNGFSYTSGRWFYMIAFFFVWAAMESLTVDTFKSVWKCLLMELWLLLSAGWIIVEYKYLNMEGYKSFFCACAAVMFGTAVIIIAHFRAATIDGRLNDRGLWHLFRKFGMACIIMITMLNIMQLQMIGDYYNPMQPIEGQGTIGSTYNGYRSTSEAGLPELQDEDTSFWRYNLSGGFFGVRTVGATPNASQIFQTRPIYSFSSTIPLSWQEFNARVGNGGGNFRRTVINGNDGRAMLDYLMGVKYFLGGPAEGIARSNSLTASLYIPYGQELYSESNGFEVYKSGHSMGLGTTYDKYITESELDSYPIQVREQVLLQAAVVPDGITETLEGVAHAASGDITTTLEENDYTYTVEGACELDMESGKWTVADPETAVITLDTGEIRDRQILISVENMTRVPMTYEENRMLRFGEVPDINEQSFKDRVKRASYKDDGSFKFDIVNGEIRKTASYDAGRFRMSWPHTDFDVNLGYYDKFDGTIKISINNAGIYDFDSIKVYTVPMDVFDDSAEILDSRKYQITEWGDDYVDGTMECPEDSIMYFSILRNRGWHIYVDGEEADKINDVNISFTGAKIPAGHHRVELVYRYPFMPIIIATTALGFIMLIVIMIAYRRGRRTHEQLS